MILLRSIQIKNYITTPLASNIHGLEQQGWLRWAQAANGLQQAGEATLCKIEKLFAVESAVRDRAQRRVQNMENQRPRVYGIWKFNNIKPRENTI